MSHFTAAELWQQQTFAYLETYSFNRGPKSAAEQERLSQEVAAAKQELALGRYMQLAKLNRKLRELEDELRGGKYGVLLPSATKPDFSTKKITVLTPEAAVTRRLDSILRRATIQEAFFMCGPIYRDALVFCNAQGQRVQVLNICFECQLMRTGSNQLVEADFATYDALQALLSELGHPIED